VHLGTFVDNGYSGFKGNRGPDLGRAITATVDAAGPGTTIELWANTSSRFGRGTGKLNETRALGKLFYDLRDRGVALRTVQDDEFVTTRC
jgi:hypothetical protein